MISSRPSIGMLGALLLLTGTAATSAHEYWIEPKAYEIEPGAELQADLKNGQNFKGLTFTYIKSRFERFTLTGPGSTEPVPGRDGDLPPLRMTVDEPGLYIAAYQSVFDRLKFEKWEKFTQYLDNQGLDGIAEAHRRRGLPETGFTEQYARCAKALIRVGEGKGEDRVTGLAFELVAEKNPYRLSGSAVLPVRLYWQGNPQPDSQIEIFRFDGALEKTKLRTDSEGRAEIPLAGGGKFLLNAVHMAPGDSDPETATAEWVSYWASLVFGIDGTDALLSRAKPQTP